MAESIARIAVFNGPANPSSLKVSLVRNQPVPTDMTDSLSTPRFQQMPC